MFLHDKMQVFLVKGNYMTLAVKPKAVELGEWIAHQGVFCHPFDLILCSARCLLKQALYGPAAGARSIETDVTRPATVYEQYQTLTKFVGVIQAAEPGKPPLCNLQSCPTMSAGGYAHVSLCIVG